MFSRLKLIIILFVLMLMIVPFVFGNGSEEVYLIGLSQTEACHPVVLDLEKERLINLKLMLPSGFNYRVFFDEENSKLYTVQEDAINENLNIYVNDIKSGNLSQPIFTTKNNGPFWLHRCVWSADAKVLSFTGRYKGKNEHERRIVLYILKINDGYAAIKEINLSEYIYSHTGVWGMPNNILIIGRSTKAIDEKGGQPDKSLLVDLKEDKISEIDFASKNFTVIGYFEPNKLAVTDFESLYNFDLVSCKKICDYVEGLDLIYGVSNDKSGFYAMLTKVEEENGYPYEKDVLSFISFDNLKNKKDLFREKHVVEITDSFVADGKFLNELEK